MYWQSQVQTKEKGLCKKMYVKIIKNFVFCKCINHNLRFIFFLLLIIFWAREGDKKKKKKIIR